MKQKNLIYPKPVVITAAETESNDNWGFKDTRLHSTMTAWLRYSAPIRLSGKLLTGLCRGFRETLEADVYPKTSSIEYPAAIPNDRISFSKGSTILSMNKWIRCANVASRPRPTRKYVALKHTHRRAHTDIVIYPKRRTGRQLSTPATRTKFADPYGGGTM